jgi:sugar phosphate isomerase/epimerase
MVNIYAFADEADPEIDGQISALKENGLNGLEIRNVDNINVSDISAAKAREVRAKLDYAGLRVWSVGSPIGKIDIEKDNFAQHLEKFRHTLETANILGAENIRIFSFYIPSEKNPADYRNEVIERLGTLAYTADGTGVTLCHENEKQIYGDTAERCLDIHKALPQIKAVFDPANFVQCGEDTLKAWEMLSGYVKYLHIKYSLKDGNIVPAGKGDGNLRRILKSYIANGGDSVTLEPHLAVFDGLAGLENDDGKSKVGNIYSFASNKEAFKAASDALKELLV